MWTGIKKLMIGALLVVPATGCSLVVDFDQSLLLDSGVDASTDQGSDSGSLSGADGGVDAGVDASQDIRPKHQDPVLHDVD